MADGDIFKSLLRSGSVSMDAARRTVARAKQATAAESKRGKKAKAARDTRSPAARNQPLPSYAIERFSGGSQVSKLKKREQNIETRQLIPTPDVERTELGTSTKRRENI
jgi:hypothetical protein